MISCRPLVGDSDSLERSAAVPENILVSAASGSPAELLHIGRVGGEGAWFALAAAAEEAGYPEVALDMRIRSAKYDPHPFGTLSLAALLIENPRALPNPLKALRRAERASGNNENLRRARIAVLAAEGRERALLREFETFTGEGWETPVMAAAFGNNPESPAVIAKLERFISHCDDPSALSPLPSEVSEVLDTGYVRLLEARKNYAAGEDRAALAGYRDWLESEAFAVSCESEGITPVFGEITAAAMRAGKEELWARLLDRSAESLTSAKRYAASYQAGKLYLSAGDPRASAASFLAASGAVPPGLERDRAVWNRLKVLFADVSISPEEEISALSWASGTWSNPERFGDVVEEFLHRCVRRGDWKPLELSYEEWGALWPSSARSTAAWLLAFAAAEGRTDGSVSPKEYLEQAASAAPRSWPALRAAGLLDILPPNLEQVREGRGKASAEDASAIDSAAGIPAPNGDEAVLSLLLDWGLIDTAYELLMSDPNVYSDRIVRRTSRALAETDPRRSIRAAGVLFAREGFVPQRDDLLLVYPLPYGDMASEAAEAEGLPAELFHGLIRVESAWDADAVSRSGAQGLSQFMPATWEEWARRLKYPSDADPMDPATNLHFGAAYLEWLREREWTDGWVDVLASYNAGGGRVRAWRQESGGLGEDLFGASIPFLEPRFYVRKVLSAATIYGYLYAGEPPGVLHRRWGLPMVPINEEAE